MSRRYLHGILLAAICSLPAHAIVYSLQRGFTLTNVKQLLGAKKALRDGVTVNGVKGDLEVSVSGKRMGDILRELGPYLKDYKTSKSRRSLLIDIPNRDMVTRLYVLSMGDDKKTVVFQIKIPRQGLKGDPGRAWPDSFPRPVSARIDQVMQLKQSRAVFAQFSIANQRAQELCNNYTTALAGSGWNRVSGDRRSGGVFMDAKRNWMLVFSTFEDQKRAHGSVFLRPVRSGAIAP